MTYTAARGPRGAYSPGRGDLTGRAYLANADEKERRELALKNTRNSLTDEPSVLVNAGGRDFLIPRVVLDAISARAEEQAARTETEVIR